MDGKRRVVVAGGGMAAARLAERLAGPGARADVELTVVGEEPHPPYNRVLLGEVLTGRYGADVVRLPPYPETVRVRRGVRAVRVDRAARRLVCADGERIGYDRLVLATGANPVLPPLRGLFEDGDDALPDGVRAFRTLDDCAALDPLARPGARAVVIGGGLLGVSAARALAARGVHVLLAHQGERLMERQLDAEAAQLLHRHLTALGVEVHTECRVRGVRTCPGSGGTRAVRAVTLADGAEPEADIVVLACGTRPRTGLAHAAGLRVGRGIRVDDRLRTSDPLVHAVGDCAEHDGVLYGRAGPAQEQAEALAKVLAAGPGTEEPRYRGTRSVTRLTLGPQPANGIGNGNGNGAGTGTGQPLPPQEEAAHLPLDLAAFGETTPRPEDTGADVVRITDATRGRYRKVVVRGDRLVGGILLGDLGSVGALARTWEGDEPLPSAPLHHLLTNEG
ncbi:FAD-dependent oxidoreductase [Streptomyces sp. ODS28]|uniref:NAD(P)/FAD-dependent oxidoreductase n=1 Tax=Streptomyces sp. ODS28 TaxID=3136688 RepID=UPI0031F1241F